MQAYRHDASRLGAPQATPATAPAAIPTGRTFGALDDPASDEAPPSMNGRILEAWRDMGASTRRLMSENPSEGRLLFFVIVSDIVFFLSWTLKTILAPTSAAVAQLPLDVGLWLLAAIFLRTAALYVFATLATAACQLSGGRGSARDTRAAIFWGALVSAPFGLAAALLGVLLSHGERIAPALQTPLVALPPYYLGLVPFLWFLAAGLAEAHRLERTSVVFLALSVATVALSFFGLYLTD
ncbi:MAG: YIP1 family protein [Pseudomonadota bacterium]